MSSTREFLESSNYDSHDPFSFLEVGATVKGTIVEKPRIVDTQYGTRMVLAVDTSGKTFSVWVKPGNMAKAVAQAVKAAGRSEVEQGGRIAIQYYADGEKKTAGQNPPKLYKAKYEAPAGSVPEDDEEPF
jgi:hypothetical protein